MTSISEKKIAAEVRLIQAEQISLHSFIVLRKKNRHSWRLNKSKQDNLNQWESMGFPKLKCDVLRSLLLFVQFKKRENTHGGVLFLLKLLAKNLQLY